MNSVGTEGPGPALPHAPRILIIIFKSSMALEDFFIDPSTLPSNAYGLVQLLTLLGGYGYLLFVEQTQPRSCSMALKAADILRSKEIIFRTFNAFLRLQRTRFVGQTAERKYFRAVLMKFFETCGVVLGQILYFKEKGGSENVNLTYLDWLRSLFYLSDSSLSARSTQ